MFEVIVINHAKGTFEKLVGDRVMVVASRDDGDTTEVTSCLEGSNENKDALEMLAMLSERVEQDNLETSPLN